MGRPTTSALFLIGVGGAACFQGEAVIFPGPTSLWVPSDPALPIVVASDDSARLALAGTAFVVEYDWSLEELHLEAGELSTFDAEDCGARTFGVPRRVTRVESADSEERTEVSIDLLVGGARLPPIDIDTCARQKGCLSVERGFAVCKKTCSAPPEPEAPRLPPRAPAPPDFCEADGCTAAWRSCEPLAAIPGELTCVDLEPCSGTFSDATPRGLEPRWVDASAAVGGEGSISRPYRTIDEALADGASDVYLGPGDYGLPAILDRNLSIYGACASRTRVMAPTTIVSGWTLWLEGLRVEGTAAPQLRVDSGSLAATEVVFGGGQQAIAAGVGTDVTLSRFRLGPYRQAIFAEGASLSIDAGVVDLTQVAAAGSAILTERTDISIEKVRFAGPTTAGSAAHFEDGAVALHQLVVLGVASGITVVGATLEASDLYVDGEGISVPPAEKAGLLVEGSSSASLRRVMLRRLSDSGLFARTSMVGVEDLTTIEVGPMVHPGLARGSVRARSQSRLAISGWRSIDDLRPFHGSESVSTLEDVYVRGGRDRAQAAVRVGEGQLALRRVVVEGWRNHGVDVASLGELDAEDLRVQTASTALFNGGDQLQSSVNVRRAVLRGQNGLTFIGIDLRASDVEIEANEVGFSGILGGENRGALFQRFRVRGGLRAFDAVDLGLGAVVLREGRLSGPPGGGLRCAPLRRWTVTDVPLNDEAP